MDWAAVAIFLVALTGIGFLSGEYIGRVFSDTRPPLHRVLGPVERLVYRFARVRPDAEMTWREYASAFVIFTVLSVVFLFLIQEFQGVLPLNPRGFGPVRWDTALNTAVSFTTNTNWQAYAGEASMSYLTQMAGLAVMNFLSAAVGLAVAIALIRGFKRRNSDTIGNFWADLTRSVIYVLIPLAVAVTLVLASQGVIQNFNPYLDYTGLSGVPQHLPGGPAASQVAIKVVGTNGGGFFNANSAHPFENPTPWSNMAEILAFLVIPLGLPFAFGRMTGDRKQGLAIFAAMMVLFAAALGSAAWAESGGNPLLQKAGIAGGTSMEGKEVRFGVLQSVLFAVSTTSTSCGAVNSMHESMLPLTGLVLLFNMLTGEVIFGGVGVGLIGILFYAILTMFLVSLMIGRTPEFIGKKLEPFEMSMAVITVLVPGILILAFSALSLVVPPGTASISTPGSQGLTEVLYAFASAVGNNGSAFGGLNANTPYYNLLLAVMMLAGRFLAILPAIAVAGTLAAKKIIPQSTASLPSASPLFTLMLIGVIIIVGTLTFLPALVLGPLLGHLTMVGGV
jgi:K+-transporting ATPase ATPase A chain